MAELGDASSAAHAAFMAVLADPAKADAVRPGLTRALSAAAAPSEPAPRSLPAKSPPETLLKIADLYVSINAHPRSFELLDRVEAEYGKDVSEIRKKYEDDWRNIVRRYAFVRFKPYWVSPNEPT
jgi:hypothetical protein